MVTLVPWILFYKFLLSSSGTLSYINIWKMDCLFLSFECLEIVDEDIGDPEMVN